MTQPGKGLRELGEGAHLRSRGEHRGCRLEERSVVGVSHHAGEAESRLRARRLRRLHDGVHDCIVARPDRRVGRQIEERVDLRVKGRHVRVDPQAAKDLPARHRPGAAEVQQIQARLDVETERHDSKTTQRARRKRDEQG
jgi:hypothetical protein